MEQIIALIDRSLRPYINDAWRGQAAETVAEALKPWLGGRGAENVGGARLDPDMPTQELRLHMGKLTASEVRVARAAIRWANATA